MRAANRSVRRVVMEEAIEVQKWLWLAFGQSFLQFANCISRRSLLNCPE
jgi:hypothetical protein